jgi:hypothetical protein
MVRRLGDPSPAFADLLRSRPRALHVIETELAKSDPQLAALFATFTLLTRDEEVPRTARHSTDHGRLPCAAWRAWLWPALLLVLAAVVRAVVMVAVRLRRLIAGHRRDHAEQGTGGGPRRGAWPWI